MKTMTKVWMVLALLALPGEIFAQDFQVIVNAANPVDEISKGDLSLIFFGKRKSFPEGGSAEPVDLEKTAPAREAFSQAVHGRAALQVEAYWAQQVFAGKGFPPAKFASDAEMIAHVAANPGAIGYVSAGASLGGGVKAVRVGG